LRPGFEGHGLVDRVSAWLDSLGRLKRLAAMSRSATRRLLAFAAGLSRRRGAHPSSLRGSTGAGVFMAGGCSGCVFSFGHECTSRMFCLAAMWWSKVASVEMSALDQAHCKDSLDSLILAQLRWSSAAN
jgi:hypothetical protein